MDYITATDLATIWRIPIAEVYRRANRGRSVERPASKRGARNTGTGARGGVGPRTQLPT